MMELADFRGGSRRTSMHFDSVSAMDVVPLRDVLGAVNCRQQRDA